MLMMDFRSGKVMRVDLEGWTRIWILKIERDHDFRSTCVR